MELKNKTILITGGSGSIGSAIVTYLVKQGAFAIVFDISGNTIVSLQERLRKFSNATFLVGDITDRRSVENVFRQFDIDAVIHCAAHKHVSLMQENIYSLVKNNVLGLKNVVDTSAKNKIKKFVFLSSDKAVYPSSFMGSTKRLGELFMSYMDMKHADIHFCSIRFGNVLYTNGSVFDMFEEQWKNDKKILITDRGATRFFISQEEATRYIIYALQSKEGDLFVGNYTNERSVFEIATQFLRDKEILETEKHIKCIGLRPGEKKVESLCYNDEVKSLDEEEQIFSIDIRDKLTSSVEKVINNMIAQNNYENQEVIKKMLSKIS